MLNVANHESKSVLWFLLPFIHSKRNEVTSNTSHAVKHEQWVFLFEFVFDKHFNLMTNESVKLKIAIGVERNHLLISVILHEWALRKFIACNLNKTHSFLSMGVVPKMRETWINMNIACKLTLKLFLGLASSSMLKWNFQILWRSCSGLENRPKLGSALRLGYRIFLLVVLCALVRCMCWAWHLW